jgi:hypothetical protein
MLLYGSYMSNTLSLNLMLFYGSYMNNAFSPNLMLFYGNYMINALSPNLMLLYDSYMSNALSPNLMLLYNSYMSNARLRWKCLLFLYSFCILYLVLTLLSWFNMLKEFRVLIKQQFVWIKILIYPLKILNYNKHMIKFT